jgi:hypothetical protein
MICNSYGIQTFKCCHADDVGRSHIIVSAWGQAGMYMKVIAQIYHGFD